MSTPRRFRMTSQIEFNLVHYLEREFVNAGFYINVPSGSMAVDGQRADILRRVDGNIYESFTDRWVIETDAVGVSGYNTIDPSGVVVDGVFHARGSSPHEPAIDFRGGRVIFEGTPVSVDSTVGMRGFSYKGVVVDLPDDEAVNLIFSQIRDNVDFTPNSFPSGNQRQFPLVVVDLQDAFNTPAEIGGGKNRNQLVVFHILGNDKHEVNAITDFLQDFHYRKVIQGVDFNLVPETITINGDRASTYVNYSQMQASGDLTWHKLYIDEARVRERTQFFSMFRNRVDWRIRLYFVPPGGG